MPSVDWLLYSAIRKEALLTSQIEGTQATLTDLFDGEAGQVLANTADVEEVTNYQRAFRLVRDNLRSEAGLPISVRLLCDAHRLLLDGALGAGKQPGELRRSQNWIGGTRPGRATFVPSPPDQVQGLLADLERFIHDPAPALPPLVRVALVYAQFETIHPFLDGNGRIGRLLIAALLQQWGLLPEPLVYLSGYLKQHQAEYYRRLTAVRTEGDWEGWVGLFSSMAWRLPRPMPSEASLRWRAWSTPTTSACWLRPAWAQWPCDYSNCCPLCRASRSNRHGRSWTPPSPRPPRR